jgi:hypothetical protein
MGHLLKEAIADGEPTKSAMILGYTEVVVIA